MTMSNNTPDIRKGRLSSEEYAKNFCDIHPPFDQKMATLESSRCFFCYDAPCMEACPSEINIPEFIRRIHTGNTKGAGAEILASNILGGTCARVCPVEILCEQACVRNDSEEKPVKIGLLQRFATDHLFKNKIQTFTRAKPTGKKIAVVGGGPAGLSCAHKLAHLGHEVEIFEALPKAGGLNEYGIAAYKMIDDFAQKEIEYLLSIGGIKIHTGKRLGKEIKLEELRSKFSAVFLSIGLGGVNALKLEGENLPNVINAVEYIAELRQTKNYADMKVGRDVVVIGGGNTAIDIAIQSKALGAEKVTLVYRRGSTDMSATQYEQELAQTHGVEILYYSKPVAIEGDANGVKSISFENKKGERFTLKADMVFKAIGQLLLPDYEGLELDGKKIKVDANKQTTLKGVYAGGDCIHHKEDLTVAAVQDGKIAGYAIHEMLTGEKLYTPRVWDQRELKPHGMSSASSFAHLAGGHSHG